MEILIKNQAAFDALPTKFDEFTVLKFDTNLSLVVIKKLPESSRAELWGSSRAELWGSSRAVLRESSSAVLRESSSAVLRESSSAVLWESSRAELWGSSGATAWDTSTVHLCGSLVTAFIYLMATVYIKDRRARVKKLLDKATAKFCVDFDPACIEEKSKSAQVIKPQKEIDFETYLERGWVKADGIMQKLVKRKRAGSTDVFEVENPGQPNSYVIRRGDLFSHGKTIEEAKDSLKYKISTRDTSEFKKWKVTDKKPLADLIRAYRAITGACEFGTRQFCESKTLKEKYTIREVIDLTAGQFGSDKFKEFWA